MGLQSEKLADFLNRKIPDVPIEKAFINNLTYRLVKDQHHSSSQDVYKALSYTVRDRLAKRWLETQRTHHKKDAKRVNYLSMEFLIGRLLKMNIDNLNMENSVHELLDNLGLNFEDIEEEERDAGLGNGGLGRLAACFLESMATLDIPSFGYGIRYDYGLYRQKIENGFQIEIPDKWLEKGYPWEIKRAYRYRISFYGRTEREVDKDGKEWVKWVDTNDVFAVPYDIPVPGFLNGTVNTLRLWSAESDDEFRLQIFNNGDFINAYEEKIHDENITKVLYPNDNVYAGRELRLRQEFFFSSASLQDIIRRYKESGLKDFSAFPDKNTIQLNDTHPAIAIPELIRLLVDVEGVDFETAWEITKKTFAYTNHTLLPEALEKWPERMVAYELPRHLEIIYLINEHLMADIQKKFGADVEKMRKLSIIEESSERMVRMAYLAVVSSFSINGVSELHTELIKERLLPEFHELYPERFNNKTNGITPRRWLYKCNPRLTNLISARIGAEWLTDLYQLRDLEKDLEDKTLIQGWRIIKQNNKRELSDWLNRRFGFSFDPESLLDVQVKRIHEYKRQILNLLHVIYLYRQIKQKKTENFVPRTVIIGGKAAPAYHLAKLHIKLINAVADVINNDPEVNGLLKLFFIPNYNVSAAEIIIPAADLSEQISTAGKEASGTGNMKFALNGALTIGTLDGANVEIREEVGEENIFIFGLTAPQVKELKDQNYHPQSFMDENKELTEILHMIRDGFFSPEQRDLFYPVYASLAHQDAYLVLADFESYIECQESVAQEYLNHDLWTKKSILNVTRIGKFSSDRTISEYNRDIWKATPIKVEE